MQLGHADTQTSDSAGRKPSKIGTGNFSRGERFFLNFILVFPPQENLNPGISSSAFCHPPWEEVNQLMMEITFRCAVGPVYANGPTGLPLLTRLFRNYGVDTCPPRYGRRSSRMRFGNSMTPNCLRRFRKPVVRFRIGYEKISPTRPSTNVLITRFRPCRSLTK